MSYSFSAKGDAATLQAELEAARDGVTFNEENADASKEQATAAIELAMDVFASGVVGSDAVSVTISGHANPSHEPRAGWANDSLTISISSLAEQVPTQASQPASEEAAPPVASASEPEQTPES